MAITKERREERTGPESTPVKTAIEATKPKGIGSWLTTIFSALAVGASCVSVYVSTLQGAQLEIYLPPAFQYTEDADGENFTIPITIANSGARSSAVVSMDLEVQNLKTNATKRFYSAYLGEYPNASPTTPVRQFTPLAILGHGVFSETVRFYPVRVVRPGEEKAPRIVSAEGDYTFRLKVNTAAPSEPSLLDRIQGRTQPAPVSVAMTLPNLDFRRLMQLRNKDWSVAGR